jgi:hypothetical protein
VGTTPVEVELSTCRFTSTSPRAPAIVLTKNNTLAVQAYGVAMDQSSVGFPSPPPSAVYFHGIAGAGPAIANFQQKFGILPQTAPNQDATASVAADGIGFQLGLSPLP